MSKKIILYTSVIIFMGSVIFWQYSIDKRISEKGYYKGTVIDKTISTGRSSTHYLYIDWDGFGESSIVAHPVTYKRTLIGSRYSTEYSYSILFGAIGSAYVPDTGDRSFALALLGVFFKILILIGIIYLFYVKCKNNQGATK